MIKMKMHEVFGVLNQHMGIDYHIGRIHRWKYRIYRKGHPVAAVTLDEESTIVHIVEGTNFASNREGPVLARIARELSSRAKLIYSGSYHPLEQI